MLQVNSHIPAVATTRFTRRLRGHGEFAPCAASLLGQRPQVGNEVCGRIERGHLGASNGVVNLALALLPPLVPEPRLRRGHGVFGSRPTHAKAATRAVPARCDAAATAVATVGTNALLNTDGTT